MNAANRFFTVGLLVLAATRTALAGPCAPQTFEDTVYTVCTFDAASDDVRVFWKNAAGAPFNTFDALAGELKGQGLALAFAMNGGMYGDDFAPTGLLVVDGKELHAVNTKTVTGEPQDIPNFYKQPNGVFFVAKEGAGVLATEAYIKRKPVARFATQSGPMLVIGGELHPAFIENSPDRKKRDGVGVCIDGKTRFAITEGPVNFHGFARFFRDGLKCPDALFLDGGSAPGLFAPELGRDDPPGHGGYGPIIGVVTKLIGVVTKP